MKLNKKICALLISSSLLSFAPQGHTQGVDAENIVKDSAAPPEADLKIEEEAPPPVEAPYPNAKTEETVPTSRVVSPKRIQQTGHAPAVLGVPHAVAPAGRQAPLTIQKPKSVDEDGNYYYEKNSDSTSDEVDVSKVPPPAKSLIEGNLNVTRPIMIKKNGDYFYGYEKTTHNHSASIKVGFFPPPNLTNPNSNGVNTFKSLYSDHITPAPMFDYEKEFHRSYGDLGIRFGTGVFYAQGKGRFVHADPERDPTYVPEVNFTMIMFPSTLTGLYHFRYTETQIFSPYFGGGGGLFAFTEIRDDNLAPKFGGAAVAVALGGINIMIDGVEPGASRELESAYGVSHVALNIEFTQFVGLSNNYDFTSSVVNFGFNLEF